MRSSLTLSLSSLSPGLRWGATWVGVLHVGGVGLNKCAAVRFKAGSGEPRTGSGCDRHQPPPPGYRLNARIARFFVGFGWLDSKKEQASLEHGWMHAWVSVSDVDLLILLVSVKRETSHLRRGHDDAITGCCSLHVSCVSLTPSYDYTCSESRLVEKNKGELNCFPCKEGILFACLLRKYPASYFIQPLPYP